LVAAPSAPRNLRHEGRFRGSGGFGGGEVSVGVLWVWVWGSGPPHPKLQAPGTFITDTTARLRGLWGRVRFQLGFCGFGFGGPDHPTPSSKLLEPSLQIPRQGSGALGAGRFYWEFGSGFAAPDHPTPTSKPLEPSWQRPLQGSGALGAWGLTTHCMGWGECFGVLGAGAGVCGEGPGGKGSDQPNCRGVVSPKPPDNDLHPSDRSTP
jgi:hypothetical protein